MKRALKRTIFIVMAILIMCPIAAMASPRGRMMLDENQNQESALLPETVKKSVGRDVTVERSKALASAMCSITDSEKGILYVYAETAMFIPVDWAALTIYLEKWNEDNNKWSTVEIFEKEFTPDDTDDGELTRVIMSIDVGNQPVGYYYRLRCIHELEYDNGWYEAKSTKTDGIMLTDVK